MVPGTSDDERDDGCTGRGGAPMVRLHYRSPIGVKGSGSKECSLGREQSLEGNYAERGFAVRNGYYVSGGNLRSKCRRGCLRVRFVSASGIRLTIPTPGGEQAFFRETGMCIASKQ